jgi:hypothetical protein
VQSAAATSQQFWGGDNYVDLYDFAARVKQKIPALSPQADAVTSAIDAYTLRRARNGYAGGHGVSIYFPTNPSSFYSPNNNAFAVGADWKASESELGAAETAAGTWGQRLVSYIHSTNPNGADVSTPPDPIPAQIAPEPALYLPYVSRN